MLRYRYEDARWECHVEDSVFLGMILFNLLQVLLQILEGFILIILAGDIGAQLAEFVKLLFHVLRWRLHVALHSLEKFFVVHLSASISNDFDVLG